MSKFYVLAGDEWNVIHRWVEASDHFDALFAFLKDAEEALGLDTPIKICNQETNETKTVIGISCASCCVPVFDSDEWMLTDEPGEFQHVDCYWTDRFPERPRA